MLRLKDKQYLNEIITKSREIKNAYQSLSADVKEQAESFSEIRNTMKSLNSDINEIENEFEEDLV